MTNEEVTNICSIAQLEEIASWRTLMRRPIVVRLQIAGVFEDVLTRWQPLINRQLSICGCTEGAILVLVAACAYVLYSLFRFAEHTDFGWSVIGPGIGICFIAAVIGKLAGLVHAQIRLSRYVRCLKSSLAESRAND